MSTMSSSSVSDWNPSSLQPFQSVAGHDGMLSDTDGEVIIKPCKQEEVDFYQTTVATHPDFAELIPTFMGTLSLGAPDVPQQQVLQQTVEITTESTAEQPNKPKSHAIRADTGIVLENLEHSFNRSNVLDIKLGARLYAPGTPAEKAARLDKVAAETTTGSLNFRVAGMRVWNHHMNNYDVYDKHYGRRFTADNVNEAFDTFSASLFQKAVRREDAEQLLETMLAEVTKVRYILERAESRFYSSSLLIVLEADAATLDGLMGSVSKTPQTDERAPTVGEVKQSEAEQEEEEEADEEPEPFKVRMIDFAHSRWCPGEGPDENVIVGLKNVEGQLDALIAKLSRDRAA